MDLGIGRKRALVLAASRGLGHGIAVALAREGVDVLLCGRSEDKLAANCDAINAESGGRADFVVADLNDPGFAEMMAAKAKEILGGVDILVNNTGGPTPGTTDMMSPEKLAQYFQSMVVSVISLTNLLLPEMKERGWGRILTCASSGVIEPIPNLALSNTLRASLAGWSKTLSAEVAQFGVTSNLLLPGRILTDRILELDTANAQKSGKSLEAVRAESVRTIPAGRLGDVQEFAATAAFLCSEPASYITGAMIRCDGGASKSI
ncbi:SDR family oxidoreductase [Rhizobium sp. L1K21]|uniref:SDR family oxidoreductase n=1 Tax=Rhizobium sp. L1K21 TaxID=2954933 RepID=UPI0020928E5B|nr:SDR family oxidoreductase [Rhizobium sp. L1K21]MCO6186656.1 SDR family oxidoreductase [Rhizobium sp. L1K21]